MMLNISRFLFWTMLIFAPLAFGSMESWALFLMTCLCGAALLCYLVECWRGSRRFHRIPGLVPLLCMAVFMVLQMMPLPAGVLQLVSPKTLSIWQQTAGLLADTSVWRLSLNIKGTVFEMTRFAVCFGGYVLALQLLSDRATLKRTTMLLACFGGGFAFFSIVQSIFTIDHALWFRHVPVNAMVFGSYVCHNHYAGLMEMLIPVTLAIAIAHRPLRQFGTRKERLIGFFEEPKTPIFLLLCFCTVIMVVSVFASLSRGGIVSMSAALVIFGAAMMMHRRTRRVIAGRRAMVLFLVAVLIAVSWFGWRRIDQRFGELPIFPTDAGGISRLQYWTDSLDMIRAFPVAGTGMGSFQAVFPAYQSFFSSETVIAHAHNDYLELLAEGGLIAGGLCLILLTALFLKTLNRLRARRERYSILISLGAAAGIIAILIHGIVDFNLRITANAFYFSVLFALMVAASHTRMRKGLDATCLAAYGKKTAMAALIGVMCMWVVMLVFTAGVWFGEVRTAFFKNRSISLGTPTPVLTHIALAAAAAASVDPLDAAYDVIQGDARLFSGDSSGASVAYKRAVRRLPTWSEALQKTGLAMAYAGSDVAAAEPLMAAGVKFAPMRLTVYKQYAAFLFAADRRGKALEVVARGIMAVPERSRSFFEFMRTAGVSPLEMIAILPKDAAVYYHMAMYVRKTPHGGLYIPLLEKAMEIGKHHPAPPHEIYYRLADAYVQKNDLDAAIHVLEKGLARYSNELSLLYKLARLYEKNGIFFKANRLFQMIYFQDPSYRDVKARLAETG